MRKTVMILTTLGATAVMPAVMPIGTADAARGGFGRAVVADAPVCRPTTRTPCGVMGNRPYLRVTDRKGAGVKLYANVRMTPTRAWLNRFPTCPRRMPTRIACHGTAGGWHFLDVRWPGGYVAIFTDGDVMADTDAR